MWWPGRYLIENVVFPAVILALVVGAAALYYEREVGRREAAQAAQAASTQAGAPAKTAGVTSAKP